MSLDHDEGLLDVTGPAIPSVSLRRAPGTEAGHRVPIGTREATDLALTVDGVPAPLALGKGRLTRRSYAVDVTAGGTYRLVPHHGMASRLLLDGDRLGSLVSQGNGIVEAARWRKEAKVMPFDAAIGYALAAGFGTGGRTVLGMALESVLDFFLP
ncbi:hypothetical protein J7E86_10945 [Streptomyces sp. ISL-11]|nr:hypothetical protein [Streptomyces sp. ISL-11]